MRTWFSISSMVFAVTSALTLMQSAQAANELVYGNAALVYWQSFDGLPDLNTENFNKAMATPVDQSLDKDIVKIFEGRGHVLMLLHRRTHRSYCDWGIELAEDGPAAILPHLGPARNLSRLAVLRARQRFFQGRDSDGVADVLAVMTLGRHAGRDRTLVGLLVDNAIQNMAQNVAAAYLPKLSDSARQQLASGLALLPKQNSFAQCMVSESAFLPWINRRVAATTSSAELLSVCQNLVGNELAEQFMEKSGGQDGIIQNTSALLPVYDALPGVVNTNYHHDGTLFRSLIGDAKKNPVGELLFPALDKAWHAHRRYQCRSAMLLAAVDISQRGKSALADHHDPTDGEEFMYVEIGGGFELRSKLTESPDKEDVVRLAVGSMP